MTTDTVHTPPPPPAPLVGLKDKAVAAVQGASRAGFYAAATSVLWRLALPWTDVETKQRRYDLQDAFDAYMQVLQRPGMRRILAQVEREDWATLPFFAASLPVDALRVLRKRRRGLSSLKVRPPDAFPYPDYYLHDFHNQANGGLSLQAALTYEWQIRFLFLGTNRVMRQGVIDEIPPGNHLEILDVACGTASWVTQARLQGRAHAVTGIDLSPAYLQVARAFRGKHAQFIQMNAEAMDPSWTNRFDLLVCIWLFHELPEDARERVAAEMARVLKPGGTALFMDAAQAEDYPGRPMSGTHDHFHEFFAEPHYPSYLRTDLRALFARHGLQAGVPVRWYRSRLMKVRKPA